MPHDLADDLRAEIAQGHVLVVVGTGVSLAASGEDPSTSVASWTGLLENGVDRCLAVRGLPPDWAESIRARIRSRELDSILSAAEEVSTALSSPDKGPFKRWLRTTVGSLHATNRSLIEAIGHLNLPIATTNYDGLLEEVTGFPPVTWLDSDRVIRVVRRQEPGIIHFHGHWADPESIVLGTSSYERILGHPHAQEVLRALMTLHALVFVGCGDGLSDPNFGQLLRWAKSVLADTETQHYRLCLDGEYDGLRSRHGEDHLHPIAYGPEHASLEPFLRTLGSFSAGGNGSHAETSPAIVQSARLPGRPRCFGREDEVRDLVETLLQTAPPPTPILGGPGAGKTTITLEALHDPRVVARFGARRLFVRCESAKSREDLVGAIIRTLGLKPGPDVEASLFAELAQAPAVLVLDNAETPWEGGGAAVGEIFSDLGSIADLALVASIRGHERPFGPNWRDAIHVGPLHPDAARKAFLDKSGRTFENDPDLDSLLEEVDRLAIAVVLLGYHSQALGNLAELRQQWRNQKTALLQRDGGQGRLENVEVSIELSISGPRMTPKARRLLSVLAHLPDGVAVEDLDTLLPGQGGAALVLRKVGLAFNQGLRVRVLAPVREYVRRQHPPQDEDLGGATEHFLKLAQEGDRVGTAGGAEIVARLVQDLGNVDSMITRGLERAEPELAIRAAIGLGEFIRFSGWGSQTLVERALDKARASGRERLHAACAEKLGDIALHHSGYVDARARYEEALQMYRGVGDARSEATCIHSLGEIALRRSDYNEARARFEAALPLFRRVRNVHGEANCIRSLGDIALDHSDHDNARSRYEEALPLFRDVGDILGEAICTARLGNIAHSRADYVAARARYEVALPLFRRIGDVRGEANCILGLGDIALARFDPESACTHFAEALGLYRMIQDPDPIGWVHVRLARLAPEGSAERRSHFRAALEAWESIKRPDLVEGLREEFGENAGR